MRPSSFLRSLSFLRGCSTSGQLSASAIVPVYSDYNFSSDLQIDLKSLPVKSLPDPNVTAAQLSDLIAFATNHQKCAHDAIQIRSNKVNFDEVEVDEYLEDCVELLDACRSFQERMDLIKEFVNSVKTAVHLMEQGSATIAIRARRLEELLDDKRFFCRGAGTLLRKCSSKLRRIMAADERRRPRRNGSSCCRGSEDDAAWMILTNSRAEAVKACLFIDAALSFKCKKGSNGSSVTRDGMGQLATMREVIVLVRGLRDECLQSDGSNSTSTSPTSTSSFSKLKNKCGELESQVETLGTRVRDLYSHIISVRMALL